MRVSYEWLKEYVDIDIAPEELAHRLTMAGIAIEGVERQGEETKGVVVGEITQIQEHPNADKLVVCQVDIGEAKYVQVVTGAPNVREGQRVPVALTGAMLPTGLAIKKAQFRGVASEGMLCSAQELKLDQSLLAEGQEEGILMLAGNAPLGVEIAEVLGLNDIIFELDLTPNRADCLGVLNIAREVAAITGKNLYPPEVDAVREEAGTDLPVKVRIEDAELCGRYVARLVDDVRIGPSPQWMQRRLRAAGMRPINNIVDVTNYVMLEMGQPLHAFDYETLQDQTIVVRSARQGEKLVTLDNAERTLDPTMLVIADAEKPVALAGVMGGLSTEVTGDTRQILLESAHFNQVSVRRTSRRLGLRSEASSRFEKGVNINGALDAATRAVQLMVQIGAGRKINGYVDAFVSTKKAVPILLRVDKVNRHLGTSLPAGEIKDILQRLHMQVSEHPGKGEMLVTVPPYRGDIELEIDLVEEVARIYGYDRIPTTLPIGTMGQAQLSRHQRGADLFRETITGCGLTEVITYSFINPRVMDRLLLSSDDPLREMVQIQNPLGEEQSMMRTTLIPNLLEVAGRNASRRVMDLGIFELGKVFFPAGEGQPNEKTMIAALCMGVQEKGWDWPAQELDFYFLKGVVEELCRSLGIDCEFRAGSAGGLHPGRTAEIMIGDIIVGLLGEVHPDVLGNFQLPGRASVLELNGDILLEKARLKVEYSPVGRYPAVHRDLAVVVREEVPAATVSGIIAATGGPLLHGQHLFDLYQGGQVLAGHRSLAYSLTFQAPDRTLTDEEVGDIHRRIVGELNSRLGAELRQ
ncbi:MAG: phenylalanine--tRNA ligase subunit beta [Bacillota bacterium]